MAGVRALFPLDGSEPTFRAVENGLKRLAAIPQAQATFMVVLSQNLRKMPEDAVEYLKFDDEDEIFIRDDEAKAVLQKAEAVAKRVKFSHVKSKSVVGKVFDSIIQECAHHDVLVMHAFDRDEHKEKARGGILEKLARASPIDVWLLR